MRCIKEKDGKYLLVSDGTIDENNAINVIIELLAKAKLKEEDVNDFGTGYDHGIAKNFVYIPGDDFIEIQ